MSYFICPVFHEQAIQNEVEIIQCEHEKNKHSDVWRTNQASLALVPGFTHRGNFGAACTHCNVWRTNQASLFLVRGSSTGLLVALLDSDAWRTNLFLVWGLVHRGMSMQRTRTAMPGGQITSFYLRSETCSHGEMWLLTIKEKI